MTIENAQWLMEHWTGALAGAIESMTEQRPECQFAAEPLEPAAEPTAGTITWQQFFKGLDQAAMWVSAPEKTWSEIGGRTLRAAGIESAEPADARNTYLEVLSQSLAGVAQAIGTRLAKEVDCEKGGECARFGAAEHGFAVTLRYPDAELSVQVSLSPALVAALEPAGAAPRSHETDLPGLAENAGAAAGQASAPEPQAGRSRNMDLLLDVELPVSVSFGRAELPIKEVLKLTTGSIVELNRAVSEPVEVVVNNCVIARGEVVVVEGNYGVRINQIISRQDRLRSLK